MTEREMEDLLAQFPSDFFPRKTLVLKDRQKSFAGVGRFDLLFEDEFQRNILMELKARAARVDDADQLVRYKEELVRRGERNVLMWLVAPQISNTVRDFLDRFGIEHTEIHFAEFYQVAERNNVPLQANNEHHIMAEDLSLPRLGGRTLSKLRERPNSVEYAGQVKTGPTVLAAGPLKWKRHGYDLVLVNRDAFDEARFKSLVDAFEQAVPSRKNASLVADLRAWASGPQIPWPPEVCRRLLRWVITGNTWKRAVPAAEAVWKSLFGEPVPTWAIWNSGLKRYEIDENAWEVWYESLPH